MSTNPSSTEGGRNARIEEVLRLCHYGLGNGVAVGYHGMNSRAFFHLIEEGVLPGRTSGRTSTHPAGELSFWPVAGQWPEVRAQSTLVSREIAIAEASDYAEINAQAEYFQHRFRLPPEPDGSISMDAMNLASLPEGSPIPPEIYDRFATTYHVNMRRLDEGRRESRFYRGFVIAFSPSIKSLDLPTLWRERRLEVGEMVLATGRTGLSLHHILGIEPQGAYEKGLFQHMSD